MIPNTDQRAVLIALDLLAQHDDARLVALDELAEYARLGVPAAHRAVQSLLKSGSLDGAWTTTRLGRLALRWAPCRIGDAA